MAAAWQNRNSIVLPIYDDITSISKVLDISSTGKANCSIKVTVSKSKVDKIKATVSIYKIGYGAVKTWNKTLEYVNGKYVFDEEHQLLTKGTYYMGYTLKCYKNSNLVESITEHTGSQLY